MDAAATAPVTPAPAAAPAASAPVRPAGRSWGDRIVRWMDIWNLTWLIPLVEICRGQAPAWQLRRLARMVLLPAFAVTVAVLLWSWAAQRTAGAASAGGLVIPAPGVVWDRGIEQVVEWRKRQTALAAHITEVETTVAAMLADAEKAGPLAPADRDALIAEVRSAMPSPNAQPIFVDQMLTSLLTALAGVALAVVVGVLVGIVIGFSSHAFEAVNPLIQVLKPVSPLAWFPVVYIVVSKTVPGIAPDALINKPFIMAAIVVALCAVWPTLINTANGVANVDKDYRNVARVLRLGWFATVWRIILPASVPAIFTGMRLSMGIGWMVLIAAEMMAVSNGLGMFVWNWYQSSNDVAMSYLIMAVIVIGLIGFLLDRLMITGQKLVSHGNTAAIR
jgi:nitrate/nitrite transport system permease protein